MEKIKQIFADGRLNCEEFLEAVSGCPEIVLTSAKEIDELKSQLAAQAAARDADAKDFAAQLGEARRDLMIDMALQKAGARNIKAVRALIKEDAVTLKNGALDGMEGQLEAVAADCPYLFGKARESEFPPPPSAGGKMPPIDEAQMWRAEAGL